MKLERDMIVAHTGIANMRFTVAAFGTLGIGGPEVVRTILLRAIDSSTSSPSMFEVTPSELMTFFRIETTTQMEIEL